MYRRTRLRLTAWYSAVFLAVLLALGAGTYVGLIWAIDREIDASIRVVTDEWAATAPEIESLQPLDLEEHTEGTPSDVFLLVFRSDGALLANPRGVEAEEIMEQGFVDAALRGQERWGTVSVEGTRLRVRATPLIQGGELVGAVVGGRSLAGRDDSVQTILFVLGLVAGGGLVLVLGAGYLLAGRALAPMRLAYERQRVFIGDASHELRSPLTLIRALAELLQRGELAPDQRATASELVAVTDEANALVDDLLLLARLGEHGSEPEQEHSDLAVVAAASAEQLRPLLEQHASELELSLSTAPAALPDREVARITRALIENVVVHTSRGTPLRLTTRQSGGRSTLVVEDGGGGVPDHETERIFERFTQLDAARTPGTSVGAGLGLAIVRAIAERRHGEVAASRSPLGGLKVEVSLPVP